MRMTLSGLKRPPPAVAGWNGSPVFYAYNGHTMEFRARVFLCLSEQITQLVNANYLFQLCNRIEEGLRRSLIPRKTL